jgi:diguanylate cyclase (GGDEF)-like protein
MWRQHLDKLAGAALLLITAMLLAWQLGNIKTGVRVDLWDCLGEITTLIVAIGWLCLIVSSRPRGPVTNWLFSGSFLLVFSYSLDLLDEVVSYPDNIRLMSWLESFPAPVGMLLLTFGLIGWHREQLAINRQLQGRELFLRDHQLIDPLTQLYGPVYLQAVLKRELNVHQQTQQPLSLLMLDLAGFSQYNKGHGIAAGDTFLMQFSELLTHQLRQQDLICRFAGDCFVAVLPQTTAATATVLNQHIAQQLQQLLPEAQIQFAAITLTLGELGEHNEQTEQWPDADTLLRRASKMLLAAKSQGNTINQVLFNR